nr:uncharacterized protein LOC133618800 isoform X1 [Nerophis lumbriciformis]
METFKGQQTPPSSPVGQQRAPPSTLVGQQQRTPPSSPVGQQQRTPPSSTVGQQQRAPPSSPVGQQQRAPPSSRWPRMWSFLGRPPRQLRRRSTCRRHLILPRWLRGHLAWRPTLSSLHPPVTLDCFFGGGDFLERLVSVMGSGATVKLVPDSGQVLVFSLCWFYFLSALLFWFSFLFVSLSAVPSAVADWHLATPGVNQPTAI